MSAALVEGTPGELSRVLSGRADLLVSESLFQLRGRGPIFTLVTCVCPHEGRGEEEGCDQQCFASLGGRRILRFDDPDYYEYVPAV